MAYCEVAFRTLFTSISRDILGLNMQRKFKCASIFPSLSVNMGQRKRLKYSLGKAEDREGQMGSTE